MEYRSYRDTDCRPSLLGLGCMRLPTLEPGGTAIDYARAGALVDEAVRGGITYFDVAYPYHGGGAEKFIGAALEKYPRESFYLATKMPLWKLETQEDMEQVFNEQLANCRVDYFDFYLCHAVDAERFEKIRRIGAFEFLARKKAEGKIRRLGFSFHDKPAVLRAICAAYPWDFAQLQLNYLDWTVQRAREQYEILQEYGLPCIVMERLYTEYLYAGAPAGTEAMRQSAVDNLLADALRAALPEARAAQEVRALTAAGPPHAQRRQAQHALAVLVQAAAPGAEDKEPVAVRAKRIIDENFADPMMGLYLVSEQLNVSNSYLSTTFKATYGVSIIQYINRLRVDQAKSLILNTDMNIKDIAQTVGFSSDINFIRVFKKLENRTPTTLRRESRP